MKVKRQVKRVIPKNGKMPGGYDYTIDITKIHAGEYYSRAEKYLTKSFLSALKSGMTHHLMKAVGDWANHWNSHYGKPEDKINVPTKAKIVCLGRDDKFIYIWVDKDPGSTYGWHPDVNADNWHRLAKEKPLSEDLKFKRNKAIAEIVEKKARALREWCYSFPRREYPGLEWIPGFGGSTFRDYLEAVDFPWPDEWNNPKNGVYFVGGVCGEKPLKEKLKKKYPKLKGFVYYGYSNQYIAIDTISGGQSSPNGKCGFLVAIVAKDPEEAELKARNLKIGSQELERQKEDILHAQALDTVREALKTAYRDGVSDDEIRDLWDEVKVEDVMAA